MVRTDDMCLRPATVEASSSLVCGFSSESLCGRIHDECVLSSCPACAACYLQVMFALGGPYVSAWAV